MRNTLCFVLLCLIGGGCLIFVAVNRTDTHDGSSVIEESKNCGTYSHISDSACTDPVISKIPYGDLRYRLDDYIQKEKNSGVLQEAGIYFRDLKNGPTLGINEHMEFVPASMLKVAVLVGYLDLSSGNPNLLKQELAVSREGLGDFDNPYDQNYVPREKIEMGKPYTVNDLLRRMIVFSDNLAAIMLNDYLENTLSTDTNLLTETFKALGLMPNVEVTDFVLSTKRYAQIFSTLYYSAYLAPDMSEQALILLEQTEFKNGLVAGVPETVTVSHKFGERKFPASEGVSEIVQLHDCGIIYYPDNPYLLCVMSRGATFDDLEVFISNVSRMFYEEVDARKIEKVKR